MKEKETEAKSFYDRISGVYDSIADGGEHAARERGLELLNIQSGESVLEVGYGTGHSVVSLAEAVGDAGRVSGVDISDGMFKVATKRVNEAGVSDRVTLKVGEVPPLPFDDNSFDVVTMSFTLELFPLEVIPDVLKETRRVLRDGGRLGVVSMATVKQGDSESALERTYKWMHQHFPHIVDCQPIAAEQFVTDAGYELATAERLDLFTMPVAALVAK